MISFTYLLIDPRNNRPFYVGQTCDPQQRYKTHIYSRNRVQPNNVGLTPTQERIREIYAANTKPVMKVVGTAWSHSESRVMEDGWMRRMVEDGYELTNIFSVMTNGRGHYREGFLNFSNPDKLGG